LANLSSGPVFRYVGLSSGLIAGASTIRASATTPAASPGRGTRLDAAPERADLRLDRNGAADHFQHAPDAQLHHARVAQEILEPDESYDVVLCREGLMFATDPVGAAGEIRRVLRPHGRVAVAVCGPWERNSWLGLVFDAVAVELKRPVPPPGVPSPFSLEDPERLRSVLLDAGLTEVAISELEVPSRSASFDEWWTRTSALAGPLAQILASLPEAAIRSIGDRLRETTAAYWTSAGLEFPGVSLVASAYRGGRQATT
jgi:SAM-dependent methyltransferase